MLLLKWNNHTLFVFVFIGLKTIQPLMKGIFSYTCWEEEASVKFIRYFLVYILYLF